jgi:hypothetical protein
MWTVTSVRVKLESKIRDATLRDKFVDVLKRSKKGCDINYMSDETDVSWPTARAILLELLLEGRVAGTKTTRGWLFFMPGTLREIAITH